MAERELHKILAVGEDTYKINAVHSDAAGQVDKTLTVNKSMLTNVEPVEFNGSEDKEVSVVPSEGGTFTGPVILPSLVNVNESLESFIENLEIEEGSELSKTEIKEQLLKAAAINYSDVLETVQNLTGHPCYHWDGETLAEVIDTEPEEGAQGEDSIALQKIRIVTGRADDYSTFIATSPVFFLYFCSDTGQMFFGMDPNNYLELGTNTKRLIFDAGDFEEGEEMPVDTDGYTAKDILTLATTVGEHTDTINGLPEEWQADIASAVGTAKTDITTGKVAVASKLETARKVVIDLNKTTNDVTFDGSSNIEPGVKNILRIANGGTGYSTAKGASYSILKDMNEVDSDITETTRMVFKYSPNNTNSSVGAVYYRPISKLLEFINSNVSIEASKITSGTLGVARGGTGKASHTKNAVLTGNDTSGVKNVATANGAFYATSANGAPSFGTLPVAQGGTGATSLASITVGAATKATKDSDDLVINKNYFRSASCVTNEKNKYVNSITISQSAPSGGNNGDIWIVY